MSYLQEVWDSGICPSCDQKRDDIDEQFSFGIYAGVMCGNCARRKYSDQCGLGPAGQGNPQTLADYGNDGDY